LVIRNEAHKLICIIENKVRTSEHDKQLTKYKEIVRRVYPDYEQLFIYLTVEGEYAEEEEDYLSISYSEISTLINHLNR